jgi:hypothetical protein
VGLFKTWCDSDEEEDARKRYWSFSEKKGGRDKIQTSLARTMRSHYDRLERIAEDVARLGYEGAATILAAAIPTKPKARSGDLGEILAACQFGGFVTRTDVRWPCAATISSAPDLALTASFGS